MVQALEALMMQRERFDYVIIETTGLANPGPVAAALWTDAAIESSVCLDAIVTVVDAKNILRHLREVRPAGAVNEAQQQVAFADVVLLNKTDLVNQNTLREVEGEIAAINAEAPVLHCERCEIDLGRILDTGLYAGNAATRGDHVEEQQSGNCAVADMEHGEDSIIGDHNNGSAGDDRPMNTGSTTHHHHQQHQHHTDHAHDDGSVECGSACCSDSQPTADHHRHGVRSVTFYVDKPVRLSRLRHWLDELLWEQESTGTEYQQTNSHSYAQRNGNGVVDPGKLDLREAFVEEIGPIEIFRIKGLLHVHNSTSQWVLQAVHELYDIVQGREWPKGNGSTYRSKLVFIGRRLNEDMLRKGIEACC
jgi:G3E family GTPase